MPHMEHALGPMAKKGVAVKGKMEHALKVMDFYRKNHYIRMRLEPDAPDRRSVKFTRELPAS